MKGNGKSRLGGLVAATLRTGTRFGFYGPASVGKTTLAIHADRPIMFDVEDGSSELVVTRYPFRDGPGGHLPRSMGEIYAGIEDLHNNDHDYGTLIIDTVDALEALIYQHVIATDSGKTSMLNPKGKKLTSIESYGFGKGYRRALDEWIILTSRLDALRLARNMDVILVGHTQVRRFANPNGEDWDRYELCVQANEKASVAGLLKGWVDVLGFCTFEEGAGKLDEGDVKAKGWSTGRRLVKLERTAAYDAKSRIAMPPEIELDPENPWTPFARAIEASRTLDAPALEKLIKKEVERFDDDALAAKVNHAVTNAKGSVATLSRFLNELRRRNPTQEEQNA